MSDVSSPGQWGQPTQPPLQSMVLRHFAEVRSLGADEFCHNQDLDTQSRRTLGCHELAAQHSRLWRRTTAQCPACCNSIYGKAENLEHVHGLSTSSDSKATGEGKERRQTCCDTELCLPYTFCFSWCFLDKIPSLATSRTLQTQVAKPWRNKLCWDELSRRSTFMANSTTVTTVT